jgi:hypothetical protein
LLLVRLPARRRASGRERIVASSASTRGAQ